VFPPTILLFKIVCAIQAAFGRERRREWREDLLGSSSLPPPAARKSLKSAPMGIVHTPKRVYVTGPPDPVTLCTP